MNIESNEYLPFRTGDKVVCIDASPPPKYAPADFKPEDYSEPDGFLKEGAIYCVEYAYEQSQGVFGVFLVGKRAFHREEEIAWYWRRFRMVGRLRETREINEVLEVGK